MSKSSIVSPLHFRRVYPIRRLQQAYAFAAVSFVVLYTASRLCAQQRVLGMDVSAWQGNISQSTWNNIHNVEDRDFVFIRSSRGGTTGYYNQSDPNNNNGANTLSQRYDDPYFVQNITRATNAGMFAGAYHFARPDIITNTGADEADHFIQMAGAWMRPGYLLPVLDLEAGQGERTANQLAQFGIDFGNRIYEVMGIHPAVYTGGNYSSYLQGASFSLRNQLVAALPTLWNARWPNQANPDAIPIQTGNPKDTYSGFYGPWDDHGEIHPWSFWQYASTGRLDSYNNGNSNLDFDVAHGGVEFLKDHLVPALWMTDSSGEWTDLANWNSGQTPIEPVQGPRQVPRVGPLTLPAVRLPSENDTVILDRPGADLAVTLSSGTQNIRKLTLREFLDITGGSLTVNYVPSPDSTPLSAQFSAPVSISGTGSLSVHTLQVDAPQTFTMSGGTLEIDTLSLMPNSSAPAKIEILGDVNINPFNNAEAKIVSGAGAGSAGWVNLGGARRTITVGDGAATVDLSLDLPLVNGSLTKSGPGGLALHGGSYLTGDTIVEGGFLTIDEPLLPDASALHLDNYAAIELGFNGETDVISSLVMNGISMPAGTWGGIGSGADHTTVYIVGPGMLEVTGSAIPGDFDENGTVDGNDLALWHMGFGKRGDATIGDGDADADFDVDGADFLIWQRQLNAANVATAVVPEPVNWTLALGMFGVLLAVRRLRGSGAGL